MVRGTPSDALEGVASRHGLDRLAAGAVVLSALLSMLLAEPARAQVSDSDQRQAAEAYDHATAAFVARRYEQAANLFETAHRLAPAAAALAQAVRSHERAGHALRAATLALQLEARYADDRNARRAAQSALRAARDFVRVDVTCDGCSLRVDGSLVSHPSFFVDPDAEHEIVASFETGEVSESVSGAAGATQAVSFEAPPAPIEPDPVEEDPVDDPIADPVEPGVTPDGGGGGVPAWLSITALVITAGLGGVLIWSGVDTLDGVPAYEMNPTMEALDDGRGREARTNWLIAGTSVAAAATLFLLIFTDWGGDDADPQALFELSPEGGAVGLRGRF